MKHYFFIDEFQEVVSRNIGAFFKQCRDRGISIIGALQQLADLNPHPVRLASTVLGNIRFLLTLSAKDDEGIKHAVNTSGTMTKRRTTISTRDGPQGEFNGVSLQDYQDTAINIDDIHRLNNTPGMAVLDLAPGDGFCWLYRPTMIHVDFITSEQEFERLKALPWPGPEDWAPPSEKEIEATEKTVEETESQLKDIIAKLDSL